MQALPSGSKSSDLPDTFPCANCNTPINHSSTATTGAAGYAIRAADNEMICYACAWTAEMADASRTGTLFAYVHGISYNKRSRWYGGRTEFYTIRDSDAAIVGWPGKAFSIGYVVALEPYMDNFGGIRIPLRCQLPTGPQGARENWYGTYYASAGDYCRLRRCKHQHHTTNTANTANTASKEAV